MSSSTRNTIIDGRKECERSKGVTIPFWRLMKSSCFTFKINTSPYIAILFHTVHVNTTLHHATASKLCIVQAEQAQIMRQGATIRMSMRAIISVKQL